MANKIGLEAIFEMRDFNRGMTDYMSKVASASTATHAATLTMGQQYVSLGGTVQKWMGKAAKAVGVAAVVAGGAAVAIGVDAVKTSASLESAFAGVVKTTDGLTSSYGVLNEAGEELKQQFIDLSLVKPVEAEELMRIGEIAGQLGIPKEALIEFTGVIADIGTATDLSTEEAAMGFAQFMNIMGTPQEDVDRLGSAIVDLGNNFATNEPQILAFAQRIAGAGQIAGLTEADVLGIGAAMASVGVEAEAGGTAVQKVLLAMNAAVIEGDESLAVFARTAGMSADEFAAMWQEDAGAAFERFVTGLGEQGDAAVMTLGELKLEDQRLVRAFLSLSNAGDLLGTAMDRSATAWAENTALAEEAGQRYATTESQMAMLKNQVRMFKGQIGEALMPAVAKMLELFRDLAEKYGPKLVELFETRIAPAIETAVVALGQLIGGDVEGALTTLFGSETAAKIIETATALGEFIGKVASFVGEHSEGFIAALVTIGALLGGAVIAASIAAISAALGGVLPIILGIGAAVGVVTAAWTEDWGGIRTFLTDFWENTLQPFFAAIGDWLGENIPAAIAAVKKFWEEKLQPVFKGIADWLGEKVPGAIAILKEFWETKVKKVFADIGLAVEGIVTWFEQLGEKIGSVREAFDRIKDVLEGALGKAFQWFSDTILANWVKGFDAISTAIDTAMGWLGRIGDKIGTIKLPDLNIGDKIGKLPDWLIPGSPTPFELGLRGISEAMRDLAMIELPRIAAALQIEGTQTAMAAQQPVMVTVPAQGGGAGTTVNISLDLRGASEDVGRQAEIGVLRGLRAAGLA